MTRWIRSLLFASAVVAPLASCTESTGPRATAAGITLSATDPTVLVGRNLQLTVRVVDDGGRPISGVPLRFTSSDTTIATVSNTGLVRGRRAGFVEITAVADDVSGRIDLDVLLPPCPLTTAPTTLTVNTTATGNANSLDCFMMGGGNADAYQIAVTSNTSLLFKLHAPNEESQIWVMNSAGTRVAYGESYQPGDTARTVATLGAGTYFVYAIFGETELESFTLRASPASPCTAANNTGVLAVDQSVTGTLDNFSCLFRTNGAPGQSWTIAQMDGNPLALGVRGVGFQPFIVLLDQDFQAIYASSPITADSTQLFVELPLGNYYAMVTSIDADFGSFTLSRSAPAVPYCSTPTDTITPPATVNGTLSTTDCMYESGFYSDPILLEVTAAAQTLRIDQSSLEFDSYLTVTDTLGNVIAVNDDAGPGTLDSRVSLTFPQGKYIIYPSSFDPSTVGAYTISVTVTAGVQGPLLRTIPSARGKPKRDQRSPLF